MERGAIMSDEPATVSMLFVSPITGGRSIFIEVPDGTTIGTRRARITRGPRMACSSPILPDEGSVAFSPGDPEPPFLGPAPFFDGPLGEPWEERGQ